ncbi:pyrroloquinoline quinone biosynthesis protein PqqC [Streptomyces fodineus]|uniref:Pyrroloquinoline-quinone synthase n=1 Tax=Streptomyces fodineus TaxID=1904616 RepID=A0A1D7YKL7_9ACTN|nr:pyrroloquinoline-quinone synthase PqqC [Streptomyces fodineus]AOR36062.1 pyrroloquinoline quinone biosynthesis protein PqqC [Streptomyces fodineus]
MEKTTPPRTRQEFEAALEALSAHYWDKHPFHSRLHTGALTQDEMRRWIANRWYYQKCLPQKDAAILANCPDVKVRRRWVERIHYQDGRDDTGSSGLEEWLTLATAAGMKRADVLDERLVLPGVRFATDAYVHFARVRPWTEAVAASLTELFSPELMRTRLTALRDHYPWIHSSGHRYFDRRIEAASSDATHARELVLENCTTREQQDAALAALEFKCGLLWSMLDALDRAGHEEG